MVDILEHNGSVAKDRSESVIVQPFADVDDQIASFCTAFTDLRKDFDSRLSLSMSDVGSFSSYSYY